MTTDAQQAQDALNQLSYKDALRELEQILDQIERDEVDLDELASFVERAASLLQLCRGRITQTEQQVRRIIDALEDEAP